LAGLLPFEWAQFEFYAPGLLAVLLVAPVFALLGCMVVNNQMAFFSEALGHAALTGIALGALAGLADPLWAMILFAAALTLALAGLRRRSAASMDTLIGLVMACAVALGVALLSRGGGFNKYSRYLVGDILTITPPEIGRMALMAGPCGCVWLVFFNRSSWSCLVVLGAQPRIRAGRIETAFALVVALVVTISIQWVGLL
jgi:zinc transport system permease protein